MALEQVKKTETAENEPAAGSSGSGRMRIIVAAVIVVLIASGLYWLHVRGRETTDDAEVDGHITQIAARVGGTVTKVLLDDNQHVKTGDVLVQLDERDYQVAVDRARAALADAQANAAAATTGVPIAQVQTSSGVSTASGGLDQAAAAVAAAEKGIQAAQSNFSAAQAHQREREATATKAEKDVERLRGLVQKDEVSQQQFDAAVATAQSARAAVDAARSDVTSAEAAVTVAQQRAAEARAAETQARANLANARTAPQQLQVTRAKADAAQAQVAQAQATLQQAQLNLQYTAIKAPTDGVISRRTVEPGQVIQAGQPLFALVDLADVWITANFKETQLKEMHPGQQATISVDGLGGREFKGHIDSIAAATGAKFSLLPPENASGNYVKVVQRVPVKIVLEQGEDSNHLLRPGMSVTPTVFVK
jgi:membrane fusion protein (multidrug efflux system)